MSHLSWIPVWLLKVNVNKKEVGQVFKKESKAAVEALETMPECDAMELKVGDCARKCVSRAGAGVGANLHVQIIRLVGADPDTASNAHVFFLSSLSA